MHLSAQLRIQSHLRNDLLNIIAVSFRISLCAKSNCGT